MIETKYRIFTLERIREGKDIKSFLKKEKLDFEYIDVMDTIEGFKKAQRQSIMKLPCIVKMVKGRAKDRFYSFGEVYEDVRAEE